ncbi:MAG: nucleotidyltransferase domain-containing protein [Candidatus Aenigmarchaeota archaeon]|nr:nucleotidyltransferase domain-containing protein [Candidatus Aenigmarchaeota archaeon]
MLEKIFSSRVGTRLVLKMGREPYREFYLYQLSKELNIGLGRTKTLLEALKSEGLLTSFRSGKRIMYRLNENNKLVYDIIYLAHKDDLLKTDKKYRSNIITLADIYRKALGDNLISAVLFGSVATKKAKKWSDIDILLIVRKMVGKKAREAINKKLSSATDIYENISEEHYFTEKEFEEFYAIGDDFLINVMKDGIILHDREYFSRYLMRGVPKVTKKSIRKRLDFSKKWLDSSFNLYKHFPQGIPSSLDVVSIHLSRAVLLLHGILPGSKHNIPDQLARAGETKLSRAYKTTKAWSDSPPLKVEKEKIWKMLVLLKEKHAECSRKLEEWA